MEKRRHILDVMERKNVQTPPVSIRLDLWYNDAVRRRALAKGIENYTLEEVEEYLGFCRTARFRNYFSIEFENAEQVIATEENDIITTYKFSEKNLVSTLHRTPQMISHGIRAHHKKYPIEAISDYSIMATGYHNAKAIFQEDKFIQFDKDVSDKGLPMLILGPCPAHTVMLNFVGYEKFYLDYYDKPERVEELIFAMDTFYRKEIWPAIARSSAKLVLHGAHFSAMLTPKPIFEKFFIPYFSDFCSLMHKNYKYVAFHADAELGELCPYIFDIGFDVADCLATAPLVKTDIDDYFRIWKGKVTCWGGLPSIIFDPSFGIAEYKHYVDYLVQKVKGRNDFIFGASDNVMPGADWERLAYLAKVTGTLC